MESTEEQTIIRLREKVEEMTGRKMRTPKDFNYLADEIFEKTHEQISVTTLKRVWGYIEETASPRMTTLDVLAQFVDYPSWEDFKRKSAKEAKAGKSGWLNWRSGLMVSLLVLIGMGAFGFYGYHEPSAIDEKDPIIKVGERFTSPQEYLKLFGIEAKDSLWGQVVPHHPIISIWGPTYHHPRWHNEGDRKKMMPTITEYWTSPDVDPEDIAQRNFDQYKHYKRLNEVRITFMKNLVDSNYVYLGVYRLSLEKSDTTKCVWEKVADDCDLNKLDYLETLRN